MRGFFLFYFMDINACPSYFVIRAENRPQLRMVIGTEIFEDPADANWKDPMEI